MLPEGITPVQRIQMVALHCSDRLRGARSLKSMTNDWQFFTVGCLYTFGGLDYDVVAEYTHTHPDADCTVMTLQAQYPIFTGMCPPGWPDRARLLERQLWAMPLEFWPGLRDRIAEVGMVDRKRGRYAQATVIEELEIIDHLAIQHAVVTTANLPTVKIAAFGIDGTHCRVGFASRVSGPHDKAAVVRLPINEKTRQVGQAILAGNPQPLIDSLVVQPMAAKIPDPVDINTLPAARRQELNEAAEQAREHYQ
jgi:hypothetical protein